MSKCSETHLPASFISETFTRLYPRTPLKRRGGKGRTGEGREGGRVASLLLGMDAPAYVYASANDQRRKNYVFRPFIRPSVRTSVRPSVRTSVRPYVRPYVRPLFVRPLTPICSTRCLYLVRALNETRHTSCGCKVAGKVFKIIGQRSRSYVHKCVNVIYGGGTGLDGVLFWVTVVTHIHTS